jgi:hypothetical protein
MTDPQLDTLTALDWHRIGCQCHKHRCPKSADFIVETHAIGRCDDPDLNPDGNTIQLLCGACLRRLTDHVEGFLNRFNYMVGIGECDTCGAPIQTKTDVIRGVQPLKPTTSSSESG